ARHRVDADASTQGPTVSAALTLPDALPISSTGYPWRRREGYADCAYPWRTSADEGHLRGRPTAGDTSWAYARHKLRRIGTNQGRSEEHTSELQSRENLVCRLLLAKTNVHDQ